MKVFEFIKAAQTVKEVNSFIKQQDEVKNRTLNFIERIKDVKQAFLGMIRVLDDSLNRLTAIVSGNKESNN